VFGLFRRLGFLAPDGRCKPFAAAADGFGLAEGVGVIVLERLSEAQRNGHGVLATVCGSAVNHGGASPGLTVPNRLSQQRVICQALESARLTAAEVDVVEAHGTGTALGDAIEAEALIAAYGRKRSDAHPLWLGSLKSNIGYSLVASGVAGVIKMVQAIRHGILPKTLHADEPSPQVDWASGNICLLSETVPWPQTGRPRRAGVSAFGISGTIAHVIVEQAPSAVAEASVITGVTGMTATSMLPWVVSARSQDALWEQAARLRSHVTSRPELALADVGFSLATTRSAHEHRAVVTARVRAGFIEGLDALASGRSASNV